MQACSAGHVAPIRRALSGSEDCVLCADAPQSRRWLPRPAPAPLLLPPLLPPLLLMVVISDHLSVWAPIMWKPLPGLYAPPTAKATSVDRLRVKK